MIEKSKRDEKEEAARAVAEAEAAALAAAEAAAAAEEAATVCQLTFEQCNEEGLRATLMEEVERQGITWDDEDEEAEVPVVVKDNEGNIYEIDMEGLDALGEDRFPVKLMLKELPDDTNKQQDVEETMGGE